MSRAKVPFFAVVLIAAVFSWSFGNADPTIEPVIIHMELRPQKKSRWCWAACGEMIMLNAGRRQESVSQCVHATKSVAGWKRTDCCAPKSSCNFSSWPVFDRFGFDSRHTSDKAIEWKQLVDEIKEANRPLCGAIKWLDQPSDPAGHMFVINGFRVDRDGVRWVHVLDPEPTPIPNSDDPDVRRGGSSYWMRFEDFRESSASGVKSGWGGYKHWDDYYAIVEEES